MLLARYWFSGRPLLRLGDLFTCLFVLLVTSGRVIISILSLSGYWFVDLFLSLLINLKIKMRYAIMNDPWLYLLWLLLLFIIDKSSIVWSLVGLFNRSSAYWSLLILSPRFLLLDLGLKERKTLIGQGNVILRGRILRLIGSLWS